VIAEQERQAQNFPIQSLVADAMSLALWNLHQHRVTCPDISYRIVLQIHDAVLLEVPYECVERVCREVLPYCMTDSVPVVPTDLDGVPLPGADTYRLVCDQEIYEYWGEPISLESAQLVGIPADLV